MDRVSDWALVALAEHQPVPTPAAGRARRGFEGLRRLLLREPRGREPVMKDTALGRLEVRRLDRLLPAIDWCEPAARLARLVDGMPDTGAGAVRVLVLPPHGGLTPLLTAFAARYGERLHAPPGEEQILLGDESALERFTAAGRAPCWIVPQLAHWYFRRVDGLALLRRFMQTACSGRLGRGLIGCDAWSFAWLQRVCPLWQGQAITLQAFDGAALGRLFAALVPPPEEGVRRFRDALSGRDVLRVPLAETGALPGADLAELAAHCRGNPFLAWRTMRRRLGAAPEDAGEDAEVASSRHADGARGGEEVIWVAGDYGERTPAPDLADESLLLLHSLLLHDGVRADMLDTLLPMPAHRVRATLQHLHNDGLVALREERCCVSPEAVIPVGNLLRRRGYPASDL